MSTIFKKIYFTIFIIFSLYVSLDCTFHYNISDSEKITLMKDYEHKKDSVLVLLQENKIKERRVLTEKNAKCSCCGNTKELNVFNENGKGFRVFCNACSKSNSLEDISNIEFYESDEYVFEKTKDYQYKIDNYLSRRKVLKNKLHVADTWIDWGLFFLYLLGMGWFCIVLYLVIFLLYDLLFWVFKLIFKK